MTKTARLNRLFDEWKQQRPKEETRGMCLDGIVCEERYEKMKPKVLFIAKEPNDPERKGFDFRKWWCEDGPKYPFSWRLCEWAYGIWNEFPPLSKFDKADELEIMRSIAFMNLKKVGGGSTADPQTIRDTTKRDRDFLYRQIKIIEPDVIVGGIGDSGLWSLLFCGTEFHDSGFNIGVAHGAVGERKVPVIDFYHPSYRVPRAMQYCLLGRVFQTIQTC